MKHRRASFGLLFGIIFFCTAFIARADDAPLLIGVATADITPGDNYPMSGYYHERLAEGTLDPLKAKAVVFRSPSGEAAWVVCDLIGISTDLSRAIRKSASEKTGIPIERIVISATPFAVISST